MQRISYLDGQRGLAILLVIFFHSYYRWNDLIHYNISFESFDLFKYGYLGVNLFFIISGFVILMTLEKCRNIKEFISRRWMRLFPAMFICSIIVFITAPLFNERPQGTPSLKDIIPGLTFIEPYLWEKLTGLKLNNLEGAFWSIYVEFKFYIVAAILYFYLGQRMLYKPLFIMFILWFLTRLSTQYFELPALNLLDSVWTLAGCQYYSWFAAGAAFYVYSKERQSHVFNIALFICLIASAIEGAASIEHFMITAVICFLFASSVYSEKVQKILSTRILLYFGFVSYPLYLLHENMIISITLKLAKLNDGIALVLFPLVGLFVVSLLSWSIAKHLEPRVKKWLHWPMAKWRRASD